MDLTTLSEQDISTQFVIPALQQAGWDLRRQVREQVSFTKGRIIVRGRLHTRGNGRRADIVLYHLPNQPIAVIEVKKATLALGAGMQQALDYAESLQVPFVFSTNGRGFLFHDRSGTGLPGDLMETELGLDAFPTPEELWRRWCLWRGLDSEQQARAVAPYHDDGSGRAPRYYQLNAINRTVEASNIYRQFSPDFFDLVVSHRGSAAEDSAWRNILDHFGRATHIGAPIELMKAFGRKQGNQFALRGLEQTLYG